MRLGVFVATVLLALGVMPDASAASVDVTAPVPAGTSVPDSRVRVLLPEGYEANSCRRYPVLYLLHGVGDTWQDWTQRSDVEAFVKQFPVIVVMPDGGKASDAGWYTDWLDGSRQWERFHLSLVDWVDAQYRTLGDGHRLIAGFSMGGFGAMSYAARHPGVFKAAAAFSGILDSMYGFPASGPAFASLNDRFGTPDERVWGDQLANQDVWRAHNPTDLAPALQGTPLFLYTGMGAPTGANGDDPSKAQNYAIEHFIVQTNLSFMRALTLAGVPYVSDLHPGYHDWPYYEAGLHWALPQMMPLVTTPAAAAICTANATALVEARGDTLPATGAVWNPLAGVGGFVLGVAALRRLSSQRKGQ